MKSVARIIMSFILFSLSGICWGSSTIDIFGTHYSEKLSRLIHRVEKQTGREVKFIAKAGGGDNNIRQDDGVYYVTISPGSAEDDIAHELFHALLESEGYVRLFALQDSLSRTLHSFIASDFDHLIINRRLHSEGYHPETGFMAGMKGQYKSVGTTVMPRENATQRAMLGTYVIHELMKHVYYVGSREAEAAILGAYPTYTAHWSAIKKEIDIFKRNPTPQREWKLVGVYVREMDSVFSEANIQFSDLIGFTPLPVTVEDLNQPASRILSASTNSNDSIVRIKASGIMVAAGIGGEPDLSQSLQRVAPSLRVELLTLKGYKP